MCMSASLNNLKWWMRFIGELPTPVVYTVGTPLTTLPMSCPFIFKNSMILVADTFDKGSFPTVASPFVFSRNIFCPATAPRLKLPVNGFSFQMFTGAPAPASAMFMLGWSRSVRSGGADELLQRFLDIKIWSEVVLNEVSAQTIVVWVCAQMSRFLIKNLV